MKYLLLFSIWLYWKAVPTNKRRKCLFKVSCSNYVYKKTRNEGFVSGLRALRFRIQNCNSNYIIIEVDGENLLISRTNEIFKENVINKSVLKSFNQYG